SRAKAHGSRGIDKEDRPQVRFVLVLFQVVTIGLPKGAPVHVSDLIARHIRPVLGELNGGALGRAEMKPLDEAFHQRSGDDLEISQARHRARIKVVAQIGHEEDLDRTCKTRKSFGEFRQKDFSFSRGISWSKRSMIDAGVMPSESALKFVTRRWARTG